MDRRLIRVKRYDVSCGQKADIVLKGMDGMQFQKYPDSCGPDLIDCFCMRQGYRQP